MAGNNKGTRLWHVSPGGFSGEDLDKLQQAAQVIREGGTVAFPTETVYGLGANGLDGRAVQRIFKAKDRPQTNPVSLHLWHPDQVYDLVADIDDRTFDLIDAFWPGPITVVLYKSTIVPPEVSAGGDTVGLRLPDNAVARKLAELADAPIAAPSANLSGRPSPTTYQQVLADLAGRIDGVVDGGATSLGIDSTVIDMTADPPVILRLGSVSPELIEEVIGPVEVHPALRYPGYTEDQLVSAEDPDIEGQSEDGPTVPMVLLEGSKEGILARMNEFIEGREDPRPVGLLVADALAVSMHNALGAAGTGRETVIEIYDPAGETNLRACMRDLEASGVGEIVATLCNDSIEASPAVASCLRQAASARIEVD